MQIIEPQVFLLGASGLDPDNINMFLDELGAKGWKTDATTGCEILMEIAGRLCYKSFQPGLNANVTRVREGNLNYIQKSIVGQHHGSVLEHGTVTFALLNVSRILTHELVRHRAGMAYSQESLRYVRLDQIRMYFPDVFKEEYLKLLAQHALGHTRNPSEVASPVDLEAEAAWAHERAKALEEWFKRTVEQFEASYRSVTDLLGLDAPDLPFEHKKLITSALRRLAPSGMATHIIATGNHRAWRHMIAMRTAPGAEEEIRGVFHLIAEQLNEAFPAIYDDMLIHPETKVCEFRHEKV